MRQMRRFSTALILDEAEERRKKLGEKIPGRTDTAVVNEEEEDPCCMHGVDNI